MAEFLRSDHPLSLRDAYSLIPADIEAWSHLDYSVRTGKPAFDHVHGCGYWEYMQQRPAVAERFDRAQEPQTRLEVRALLRAFDWGRFRTVADVGGGNGAFLAALLAKHPEMRGVLFDQPDVVARAPRTLDDHEVADRCAIVAGDFFDRIPDGASAYVLKRILYGWHDAEAVTLLRTVRAAMHPESRLLIIEPLDEPGGGTVIARRFDLAMLVLKGSGARTPEHIARLCGEAGLSLATITPTLMFPIIEVRPA